MIGVLSVGIIVTKPIFFLGLVNDNLFQPKDFQYCRRLSGFVNASPIQLGYIRFLILLLTALIICKYND